MSWTAPPTFVSGAVLTAAQMNILGGDIAFLGGPKGTAVNGSQTTASAAYTDLATVGPQVTVTTGANAVVVLTAFLQNNTAFDEAFMSFAVTGATTLAASDTTSVLFQASNSGGVAQQGATYLVPGLTAGSNTFTAKYRVNSGTGTFANRSIVVFPLP